MLLLFELFLNDCSDSRTAAAAAAACIQTRPNSIGAKGGGFRKEELIHTFEDDTNATWYNIATQFEGP